MSTPYTSFHQSAVELTRNLAFGRLKTGVDQGDPECLNLVDQVIAMREAAPGHITKIALNRLAGFALGVVVTAAVAYYPLVASYIASYFGSSITEPSDTACPVKLRNCEVKNADLSLMLKNLAEIAGNIKQNNTKLIESNNELIKLCKIN